MNAQTSFTSKTLYTGKTHYQSGPDGFARSEDGVLDIALPAPHPAAEDLFGAAYAACYAGAIGVAAQQRKVALPTAPSIDAQVNLNLGKDGFFLDVKLAVSIPGVDTDVAQELLALAHKICPYSKAVHGNIAVETVLI